MYIVIMCSLTSFLSGNKLTGNVPEKFLSQDQIMYFSKLPYPSFCFCEYLRLGNDCLQFLTHLTYYLTTV